MNRSLLLTLLLAPAVALAGEDPALTRARKLLRKNILIDGHNDLPWAIRKADKAPRDVDAYDLRKPTPGHTDLARLKQGGVGGQFWSVYIPAEDQAAGFARVQLEQIDTALRIIAKYSDRLGLATTADEVERQFKKGRIASLLGIEGGHALENSLGALRAYYALGVRYMTLTHSVTLDWADAAGDESRHGGLTRFGEEVVHEMNRLGMLVDLSHTTPETMEDALRVAEAPVIFSHSSARDSFSKAPLGLQAGQCPAQVQLFFQKLLELRPAGPAQIALDLRHPGLQRTPFQLAYALTGGGALVG